jgi:hypothetical protein
MGQHMQQPASSRCSVQARRLAAKGPSKQQQARQYQLLELLELLLQQLLLSLLQQAAKVAC